MNRFFLAMLPGPTFLSLASGLLMLLLFALPLFFFPWAHDSFVFPKQVLFSIVTLFIAALTISAAAYGRELRLLLQSVNGFLFLFLLWLAASIIWSAAPTLAWKGLEKYALLFLFFLLFQSITIRDRARLIAMAVALMASAFVIAGWVVIQDFRQAFMPESVSVRSVLGDWRDAISVVGLGNTSHIADFLVFGFLCWFGALLLARRPWMKWLAVIALWLHSAGLIVCWSVHSNLSLIMAALLLGWLLRVQLMQRLRHARGLLLVLAVGWAAIIAFYVVDHPINPHGSRVWAESAAANFRALGMEPAGEFSGGIFSQAFASPRWTEGFLTRKVIWLTTLEMIRENIILGVGVNNFTYVYPATVSEIVLSDPQMAKYSGAWTNAAHNDLMQAWAEYGIIGLFILLVIIGLTIRSYWGRLKHYPVAGSQVLLAVGLAALVAILLQAQMNFPLQLPVSTMLFFLLIALPLVLPGSGLEEPEMLVPVERPYGPIGVGIIMHNMAYPSEFRLRVTQPGAISVVITACALGIAFLLSWQLLRPLRADIVYRQVREAGRIAMIPRERIIARAKQGLDIWPGHVDLRAEYTEQLLRAERWEEVVEQTPIVLRKLNAIEQYTRRAQALEQVGQLEEAQADWEEARRRKGLQ